MSGAAEVAGLLADAAVKATVVLALALAADLALRRSSAALRHLVWAVAVFGILAIPVASAGLPSLEADPWPRLYPGIAGEPTPPGPQVQEEILRGEGALIPERKLAEGASSRMMADRIPSVGSVGGSTDAEGASSRQQPAAADPGEDLGTGIAARGPTDRSPGRWMSAALALWVLGVVLVLLALAGERLLLVLSVRTSGAFEPGRVRERARTVARRMGLDELPSLMQLEAGSMPATWGVMRRTVALPADADSWSDERLESVLAHEMAHVRRRDCAVQTAAVVACALYWFHPLAWLAASRLRRERELAADDEVLALGARPSSYARELLSLAASGVRPGSAVTATAMAAEEGLPRRIRSVVAGDRRRRRITGSLAVRAAVTGALVLLPLSALAPAPGGASGGHDSGRRSEGAEIESAEWEVRSAERGPADPAVALTGPAECWHPDVSHSMQVHVHGSRHELDWKSDGCESEILVEGEIRFNEDFTAIAELSDGALLRVVEETDEYRRAVEYRPGSRGTVQRAFRRDGRTAEPTEGEERWIRQRIVTVLRQTGLAAGERVAWILSQAGPEGVLDELEWITADGPAGRYMTELLDRAGLDEPQLRRFLELGAERVGSDGVLSRVLVRTAREYPGPVAGALRASFRDAASTIGSDGSMGSLAESLTAGDGAGVELAELGLEIAASGIGSDGQMSRLLRRTVQAHPGAVVGPLRSAFGEAASTVGSDGSLGQVIRAMMAVGEGTAEGPALASLALELAAGSIGSDGEMAVILRDVVTRHPQTVTGPGRDGFLEAAGTVGSDGSLGSVVEAMVRSGEVTPERVSLALEAARTIGSDGQMASFLVHVAERHPDLIGPGGPLAGPFERVLATVGSDGEELRVRRALERSVGARRIR